MELAVCLILCKRPFRFLGPQGPILPLRKLLDYVPHPLRSTWRWQDWLGESAQHSLNCPHSVVSWCCVWVEAGTSGLLSTLRALGKKSWTSVFHLGYQEGSHCLAPFEGLVWQKWGGVDHERGETFSSGWAKGSCGSDNVLSLGQHLSSKTEAVITPKAILSICNLCLVFEVCYETQKMSMEMLPLLGLLF